MLISFIRTVILYSILILVIRLMGKRQLGEMEPMEFVVTMLLANLAAVPQLRVAEVDYNVDQLTEGFRKAAEQQAAAVVFPEPVSYTHFRAHET